MLLLQNALRYQLIIQRSGFIEFLIVFFSRVKTPNSKFVVVHLLKSYRLHFLLYAS